VLSTSRQFGGCKTQCGPVRPRDYRDEQHRSDGFHLRSYETLGARRIVFHGLNTYISHTGNAILIAEYLIYAARKGIEQVKGRPIPPSKLCASPASLGLTQSTEGTKV
jgi:hypothetical protein